MSLNGLKPNCYMMSKTRITTAVVMGAILVLLAIAFFGIGVRHNRCKICGVEEYERSFLGIIVESWCEREYDGARTYAEWKRLSGRNSCHHQFEPVSDSNPVKSLEDMGHTREGPAISLSDWKPNIDQPIVQLAETLAKLEPQQPRNYTISNVAFLYDAKLHILFHGFLTRLPEPARTRELVEQCRWLLVRERRVDAAGAEYEGGTLASYVAGQAYIDTTKKRIAEIEKKIKGFPTTTPATFLKGEPSGERSP